tara:strand:+ start:1756 stop:2256 length:501 start_codon:yes stop_codon:yes gene_type:complete
MYQNRLAKLEGQATEKAGRVKAAKSKALEVFGTDDPALLSSLAEELSVIESNIEAEKSAGTQLLDKLVPKLEAGEVLSAAELQEVEAKRQRIVELEGQHREILLKYKNPCSDKAIRQSVSHPGAAIYETPQSAIVQDERSSERDAVADELGDGGFAGGMLMGGNLS